MDAVVGVVIAIWYFGCGVFVGAMAVCDYLGGNKKCPRNDSFEGHK